MIEILLSILAIELGMILLAMVGIFGLDTYAIHQRNTENSKPQGTLRILTPEEMVAAGLNPKDFMNPATKAPGAVEAASGQYL